MFITLSESNLDRAWRHASMSFKQKLKDRHKLVLMFQPKPRNNSDFVHRLQTFLFSMREFLFCASHSKQISLKQK